MTTIVLYSLRWHETSIVKGIIHILFAHFSTGARILETWGLYFQERCFFPFFPLMSHLDLAWLCKTILFTCLCMRICLIPLLPHVTSSTKKPFVELCLVGSINSKFRTKCILSEKLNPCFLEAAKMKREGGEGKE